MESGNPQSEHTVYELFKWSIILKGLISLGEVLLGAALLFVPAHLIIFLVQGAGTWLSGHADNAIALKAVAELTAFSAGSAFFVALYLLTRGLIKCGLIVALLKNKLWAFPATLVVLVLLLIYQGYEIYTKGSIFVIAISLFDLIVVYFIWREWNIVKQHRRGRTA